MARDKTQTHVDRLNKERKRVLDEMEGLQEILKTEVDVDADEGDPDYVEREKAIALMHTLERRLEAIDHALRQAADGNYGICERCGQRIDPARLEIMPEATLCVTCKGIVERQSRGGTAPPQLW
jgi:DnaK suppressor protein